MTTRTNRARNRRTVFVVGSVNDDLRLLVERHARTGETIAGRDGGSQLGGKGANQAVAAVRAGARVHFVGAVGADAVGGELRALMTDETIDIQALSVKPDQVTGRAIVMIDENGDNAIIVISGANGEVSEIEVALALQAIDPGDILLSQLEIGIDSIREAVWVGSQRGAIVILNAAPFQAEVIELLEHVDILVVNEHERDDLARVLGVPNDTTSLGDTLKQIYGTELLCTLGAAGSEFLRDGEVTHVRSEAATVVDTTGAGDTYIGYLVSAIADDVPMENAMKVASKAAAFAVGKAGAARSIPHCRELVNP